VIQKHLKINKDDNEIVINIKETVISQLRELFKLSNSTNIVSPRQVSSFFDPRYKELKHEKIEVIGTFVQKSKVYWLK